MGKSKRNVFLQIATLAVGFSVVAGCSLAPPTAAAGRTPQVRNLAARTTWAPAPAQAPATDGIATLPGGARLWYWDTGGPGDPVILLHAATGSAASWEYQQPVLAKAGYRVIAYSRRGSYKSEASAPNNPGTGSGDLHELAEHLKLDRFHLVATAAGGFIALDYAVSHPERLLSLVVANSLGGVQDENFRKTLQHLLPPTFSQLPADFRELGPSYRAGYRPGVDRWTELHEMAGAKMGQPQPTVNKLTWAALESLRVPTLLLTGDADLYMPPSQLREFARHLQGSEMTVINEVGHSGYWEQPEVFNAELLRFMGQHRKR